MPFNVPDIIDYYKNLLIIQYNNKKKAQDTVALHIKTMLQDGIICDVQDAYNLETAVGVQLDVLGKYVNLDRFYSSIEQLDDQFFTFTSYPTLDTDTAFGLTDYPNFDTDPGGFLSYSEIGTQYTLNDDDYRFMIKLRILQNNIDHSEQSIDDGLFAFFGLNLFFSTRNEMDIDYFINADDSRLGIIAFIKGVLPRPMGVQLNYLIEKKKPFFGFANYNRSSYSSNITGFSRYSNYGVKEGEMLTYDKLIGLDG